MSRYRPEPKLDSITPTLYLQIEPPRSFDGKQHLARMNLVFRYIYEYVEPWTRELKRLESATDIPQKDHKDNAFYGQNFCITALVGGRNYDNSTRPCFGWGIEYRNPQTITLQTSEKMTKTLKRLEKGMTQMREQYGEPETFGIYIAHVAKVMGIKYITLDRPDHFPTFYSTDPSSAIASINQQAVELCMKCYRMDQANAA